MTEKFTPGEWRVKAHPHPWDKSNNDLFYEIQWSEDGERVADIIYQKADAHLMSQAKNMYECICDALTDLQMSDGMRNHFEQVLKKARGEE